MKLVAQSSIGRPGQAFLRRRFVRWISCFFLAVGVLALGYVGYTLIEVHLSQAREAHEFEEAREFEAARNIDPDPMPATTLAAPTLASIDLPASAATQGRKARRPAAAWGRITIASIGLSSMIMEGADTETLKRGIGHIPGTGVPGEPGNIALAGHRDTFFRPLRNIHIDDEITLETVHGSFRYRVDFTKVVEPENDQALSGSSQAILTLVTCYPFSFVGAAPQRFIVRAHRIAD